MRSLLLAILLAVVACDITSAHLKKWHKLPQIHVSTYHHVSKVPAEVHHVHYGGAYEVESPKLGLFKHKLLHKKLFKKHHVQAVQVVQPVYQPVHVAVPHPVHVAVPVPHPVPVPVPVPTYPEYHVPEHHHHVPEHHHHVPEYQIPEHHHQTPGYHYPEYQTPIEQHDSWSSYASLKHA